MGHAFPDHVLLAPMSRPDRSRRGRNFTVVVDVLHAVSIQVGRRLQTRLIVEVIADLWRAAVALGSTALNAERRRAGGGDRRRRRRREREKKIHSKRENGR